MGTAVFKLILIWTLLMIVGSSQDYGYFYPPVYGSFKDSSVLLRKGSESTLDNGAKYELAETSKYKIKSMRTPKFEIHVYQIKPSGEMREEGEEALAYEDVVTGYPRDMSPYARTGKSILMSAYKDDIPSYTQSEPEVYEQPKKSYKTRKCYQCEFSPPHPEIYEELVREPYEVRVPRSVKECKWEKNVDYVYNKPKSYTGRMYGHYQPVTKWEKICVPKTVYERKTKYRNRYIKKKRIASHGGFEACKGPIDSYSAKHSGVDDWDCNNNCYIKLDKTGTISRGCYSGEYKVNPNHLGCNYQGDNKQDLYCFCEGDHCNGQKVPGT